MRLSFSLKFNFWLIGLFLIFVLGACFSQKEEKPFIIPSAKTLSGNQNSTPQPKDGPLKPKTLDCFEIESDGTLISYSELCKDTEIDIPKEVIFIKSGVFKNRGLTSVTFPQGLEVIGREAFKNNDLKSLKLFSRVSHIEDNAFSENPQLNLVHIPNDHVSVGDNAFPKGHLWGGTRVNCFKIKQSAEHITVIKYKYVGPQNQVCPREVSIPNGITKIAPESFLGNKKERSLSDIKSLVIPNSVISIGFRAFARNSLQSLIIPDSVLTIEESAFENNYLTSLVIGRGLTTIERSVFADNRLNFIELPDNDNITSIGDFSFYNNYFTRGLIIGAQVTEIGAAAFGNNKYLSLVCIKAQRADINFKQHAFGPLIPIFDSEESCLDAARRPKSLR